MLTAPPDERPDAVVFALDAANPARNLYLLSQILDTGIPVVVALTMTDVAARGGHSPDPAALARELALPFVPVEGRSGAGLDLLTDTVHDTLLEDSGYFARAAFVADRLMRMLRLPGRAFLPLVVGFGCNVPALAGTRILNRRAHRLLVGMLMPYMSCTARLAVHVMIVGVFFGAHSGTVVFLLYVASVLLVVGMGLLLRPLLFRDMREEPLVLELPPYRLPTPRVTGTQVRRRLAAFLRTAGGIIVATAAGVWLLTAIPAGAGGGGGAGADAGFGTSASSRAPSAASPKPSRRPWPRRASATGTPPPPSPPASSPRRA